MSSTARKCPHDGVVLQPVRLAGIELDKCHKCDGIWFDYGELEKLRNSGMTDPEEHLENRYGNLDYKQQETSGYMRCPSCGDARLIPQHYTHTRPVKIDRCEKCLGFWLDDNELNAILGDHRKMNEIANHPSILKFIKKMMSIWGKEEK